MSEQNVLMHGRSRRIDLFFLGWTLLYVAGAGLGTLWAGRMFRLLASNLVDFCGSLSIEGASYLSCFLPSVLAVIVLSLLLLLPAGRFLIWPFIFFKAFGSGFVLSLFYLSADSDVRFPAICGILVHTALLLPVFYYLCFDALQRGTNPGRLKTGHILPVFLYLAFAAMLEYLFLRHAFLSPLIGF